MMFLQVEGVFFVNDALEKLMFDELRQFSGAGGKQLKRLFNRDYRRLQIN